MIITSDSRALQVVDSGLASPLDAALSLAPQVRAPRWVGLLTGRELAWLESHWNADDRTLRWSATELVEVGEGIPRIIDLHDLSSNVTREIAASISLDSCAGFRVALEPISRLVAVACRAEVDSLLDLSDSDPELARTPLRAWAERLELASADAKAEWMRDSVRIAVVHPRFKPGGPAVLPMGRISQPWLRQMATEHSRNTVASASGRMIYQNIYALGKLSAFLRTRRDRGLKPRALTQAAMDEFAMALFADPGVTANRHTQWLRQISSVLTQSQAMGLTERVSLPNGFRVGEHHYPAEAKIVRADKGFPDATFRLLMGMDDHFGLRAHALARSIPRTELDGEVFVQALHLAANFGRRSEELASLTADSVSVDQRTGAAQLRYDNFKSGRENVWLPIDARSASSVMAWLRRLRETYPVTPAERLALLPASQLNNLHGTRHVGPHSISVWFKHWVVLLEQAIIIGHLHRATNLPLEVLCALKATAAETGVIVGDGVHHELPTMAHQMLSDYVNDLRGRPDSGQTDLPLFPSRTKRQGLLVPVKPSVFDALGEGWIEIAGQYPSPGIPGPNMGAGRIRPNDLQVRLFRHTYLQHLVDAGVDIFIVQELADHSSVQTTIDSYVRVKTDKLREAIDILTDYKAQRIESPQRHTLSLPSQPARDVLTNDCSNPQVLALGSEGCDHNRKCYDCDHYSADPSHIPDVKSEIQTLIRSISVLESKPENDMRIHSLCVMRYDLTGWRSSLRQLESLVASLDPVERERVENAARVVREFRNRARSGGINLGGGING